MTEAALPYFSRILYQKRERGSTRNPLALPTRGELDQLERCVARAQPACPWNLSTHPAVQGSTRRRQANSVDPCAGGILILLGGPTAATHGAEKLAVPVDR